MKPDFRMPSASRKPPRAVADWIEGIIIAVADICASPARVFKALIERWPRDGKVPTSPCSVGKSPHVQKVNISALNPLLSDS